MSEALHVPVLAREALELLQVRAGGCYLDATVGLGGHAAQILERSSPDGRLFGLDRDPNALAAAAAGKLVAYGERVRLFQTNYAAFDQAVPEAPLFDGILADLGVSSLQLDDASRGFSFMKEGSLDMRMDPTGGETALEYLDRVSPDELEQRLREAGEERFARRVASFLLRERGRWRSTQDLAQGVARVLPRRGKSHPATRVFLALRMAVNQELEGVREFLRRAPAALKPGGRLAVISFHSGEDRLVKHFFRDSWKEAGVMKAVTKSPVTPGEEETRTNPRSRSAKMRVFERP